MSNHARRRPRHGWQRTIARLTGGWGPLTHQQERIQFRKTVKGDFPSLEQAEAQHREEVRRGR